MPATKFICPDGRQVDIKKCLQKCTNAQRYMFLPTLRAIAQSLDRGIKDPTVTELLCGVRETYLKKTTEYAIRPHDQLYAIHGSAVHTINEGYTEGNILSEERIYDDITSGKFDLYGQIIDLNDKTLGDYKVTSSYKLMRALGYYKVDIETEEIYKSGLRKGQRKTRKEWRTDGVRYLFDWAVQINYYRMLLESKGFKVERMEVQAMCRDYSLRIAAERNIKKPVYVIHINKISDHWIKLYMNSKAQKLKMALKNGVTPKICTIKERWKNRKCAEYCVVAENCTFGRLVKRQSKAAA